MSSEIHCVANYLTQDGRYLSFCCLQAGKYWRAPAPSDRSPGASPPILASPTTSHSWPTVGDAIAILDDHVRRAATGGMAATAGELRRPMDRGARHSRAGRGPPSRRQRLHPALPDGKRNSVPAWPSSPVQFDEEPPDPGRAPGFNEHGDAILRQLGLRLGHYRRPEGSWRGRLMPLREPDAVLVWTFGG